MSFSLDRSGLDALRAKFTKAIELTPITNDLAVTAIAEKAAEMLAEAAPFDDAPNNGVIPGEEGHLADSFDSTEGTGGVDSYAEVTTSEPIKYGYVTSGTDTPIVPAIKLAMWWPDAPHPMSLVRGQDPNPFQEGVLEALPEEGAQIIIDYFRQMFEEL